MANSSFTSFRAIKSKLDLDSSEDDEIGPESNEEKLLNHIDQLEKVLNLYRSKEAVVQNNELLQLRKSEVELRTEIEELRAEKEYQTANMTKMNQLITSMKNQAVKDVQEITSLKAHLEYDSRALLTVPDLRCFINAIKIRSIEDIDDLAAAWLAKQNSVDDTLDESK